jgi:glycosyltransferase involved in cell wall biosynthesis
MSKQSMHVMVVALSSATQPEGVCRHAANVVRGLLANTKVDRVTLCVGAWQQIYFREAFGLQDDRLTVRPVSIKNHSVSRNLWYLHQLPSIATRINADIVHLAYPMPVWRRSFSMPLITSLHDLYSYDAPQNFAGRTLFNRICLRICLQNVDAIAAVSVETRKRLHGRFPRLNPFDSHVIPNSAYLSQQNTFTLLPRPLRNAPYLLCVAQHRANKNLVLLLRGFQHALAQSMLPADTRLVIVGREGPETKKLHLESQRLDISERVDWMSGITDSLLITLYRQSIAVVATSVIEGFGLPVAEALGLGCPVVCSDIPAFRANDNGTCIFFDPHDFLGLSLANALQKAFAERNHTKVGPQAHGPEDCGRLYIHLYQSLLGHGGERPPYAPPVAGNSGTSASKRHRVSIGERL